MPDPAPSSHLDAYAAVETAYRKSDWVTVLEQGAVLNRKLARAGGANAQALRQRLELMLAHTHLYGLGNTDAAQRQYQALLNQPVEASLRQMAEDGLRQCRERGPATASASGAETTATTPASPGGASAGTAAAPTDKQRQPAGQARRDSQPLAVATPAASVSSATPTAAAAPWLTELTANEAAGSDSSPRPTSPTDETADQLARLQSGTPAAGQANDRDEPLIPEVIEEPELVEVPQANPLLADAVERSREPAAEMATQPTQAKGLGLASLAEAAQSELIALESARAVGAQGTSAAADEPDPDVDLLAFLRLVRLP